MKILHRRSQPAQQRTGRGWKPALAAILLLIVLLNILTSCGVDPAMAELSTAPPAVASPTSSPVSSPSPSPPPTLTALSTIPAAAVSNPGSKTATASPTDPPTPSPTHTPSPVPPATWTSTPTPAPTLHPNPSPVPTIELTQDIIHILLIGGDRDYVLDQNTDTLIVVVVNRKTGQMSMLSIPRDLWVYIPTYGWGRINIAQRIGYRTKYPDGKGPGLLMRTIEENLGIPIDHWVRVGYEGFARVVDELSGVEMVVPCRVNLRYKPPTSDTEQEMILEPGVHHLDGPTALRYVRTRGGGTATLSGRKGSSNSSGLCGTSSRARISYSRSRGCGRPCGAAFRPI